MTGGILRLAGPFARFRYTILLRLRTSRHRLAPQSPLRERTSPHVPVRAFATVLLTPVAALIACATRPYACPAPASQRRAAHY
jgi:hypothetical protein